MGEKQQRFVEDIKDIEMQFATKMFDAPHTSETCASHDEIPSELIEQMQ